MVVLMMNGACVGCRLERCQRVVDGAGFRRAPFLADTARQVALGVDVHQKDVSIG